MQTLNLKPYIKYPPLYLKKMQSIKYLHLINYLSLHSTFNFQLLIIVQLPSTLNRNSTDLGASIAEAFFAATTLLETNHCLNSTSSFSGCT